MSRSGERLNGIHLCFRRKFGAHIVNRKLAFEIVASGRSISSEDYGSQPERFQCLNYGTGLRAEIVAQSHTPEQVAVCHPNF